MNQYIDVKINGNECRNLYHIHQGYISNMNNIHEKFLSWRNVLIAQSCTKPPTMIFNPIHWSFLTHSSHTSYLIRFPPPQSPTSWHPYQSCWQLTISCFHLWDCSIITVTCQLHHQRNSWAPMMSVTWQGRGCLASHQLLKTWARITSN